MWLVEVNADCALTAAAKCGPARRSVLMRRAKMGIGICNNDVFDDAVSLRVVAASITGQGQ